MEEIKWFDHKFKKSNTDIFLSNRNQLSLNYNDKNLELELAWFNYFSQHSPMGKLLIKNSYKKDFSQKKILLLHITPSYNDIKKSGKIFASGGGLGSAIYCCPVHKNKKIHNLSLSYLSDTMPKRNKKFNTLIIELKLNKHQKDNIKLSGVDYTLFGKINCEAWENIKKENILDNTYIKNVENEISNDMTKISLEINSLIEYNLEELSFDDFSMYCKKIFYTFPELRFILYEVFTEYILLNQNNKESLRWKKLGELYSNNYKKMIWNLLPTMLEKFNMLNFYIDFEVVIKYLQKSCIIKNFDSNHFKNFVKWRIAFYFRKLSGSKKIIGKFTRLEKEHPYLTGQILYRRFKDKAYFERKRMEIILKQRSKTKLILPIYSLLPKGEVGINPNLSEMEVKYKIFNSIITKKNKILIKEELDIKLDIQSIEKSKRSYRD